MTSVVGLDVGNMASKIGLARKRGIDIIANEVSNRATPFVQLDLFSISSLHLGPVCICIPLG